VNTANNAQSRAYLGTSARGTAYTPAIELSHYAAALTPGNNIAYVDWEFASKTVWSFRLYMRIGGQAGTNGDFQLGTRAVLYGYGAGNTTERWRMEVLQDTLNINLFTGNTWTGRKVRLASGAGSSQVASSFSSYQIGGNRLNQQFPSINQTVRIEGKCNSSGLMTLAVFDESVSTTVARDTHTLQLPNAQMDALVVGVRPASSILCPIMQWDDIEVFDDAPTSWRGPYVPTPESFEEVTNSAGATRALTVQGIVTATGVTPTVGALSFNYADEIAQPDYRSDLDLQYAANGSALDLYRPVSGTYENPLPIIVWAHSGFFTSGSRKAIPPEWVAKVTGSGYAVASISYPLCDPAPLSPNSYLGQVKHPVQIAYYKKAISWLKANAATYGLDSSKVIGSGYSAGGYLALMANISREVTSGPGGYNLTMRGSLSSEVGSASDPTISGTYVYAAPVSFTRGIEQDESGFIWQFTTRSYMGQALNQATLSSYADAMQFVTAGDAPIAYAAGNADQLVKVGHQNDLEAACAAAGVTFSKITVVADHDNIDTVNDPLATSAPIGIVPWANALFGGPPT